MDNLYNLLFNPNHEMPSGPVLIVLFALCIVVPYIMRFIQSKREERRFLNDKSIPDATGKSAPKRKAKKKK